MKQITIRAINNGYIVEDLEKEWNVRYFNRVDDICTYVKNHFSKGEVKVK